MKRQRQDPAAGFLETPSRPQTSLSSATGRISLTPSRLAARDLSEDIGLQRRVKELELELSRFRSQQEQDRLHSEQQRLSLEQQIQSQQLRTEQLERDRRFLHDREQQLTQRLAEVQEKHAEKVKLMERERGDGQRAVLEVRERLERCEEVSRKEQSRLRNEVEQSHLREKQLRDALEAKETEEQRWKEECTKLQQQLVQQKKESQTRNVRSSLGGESEDQQQYAAFIKKQLNEQMGCVKELESKNRMLSKENERLGHSHQNMELLREQKRTVEARLRQMDDLRTKVSSLELENTLLRKEKAQWTSYLENGEEVGIDSPYALTRKLANQRIDMDGFGEKVHRLEQQLLEKEKHLGERSLEIQKLQEQLCEQQQSVAHVKKLELAKRLVDREIVFLRDQLKTYDTEEAVLVGSGNYDKQKTERIAQLETLMAEWKSTIEDLQAKVVQYEQELAVQVSTLPTTSDPGTLELQTKMQRLEGELEQLRREKRQMEKELKSADEQIAVMEKALGAGQYDVDNVRVLQLEKNPSTAALAQHERTLAVLEEENKELRQRLKSLVMPTASLSAMEMDSVLPSASFHALEMDKERLERQVQDLEKRQLRLKEVFQVKIDEFREAIVRLLGYRVEMSGDDRIRLSSTFASSEEHSLLFQKTKPDVGEMDSVEFTLRRTPFLDLAPIQAMFSYYVQDCGSIPAFLGNLTLWQWEQQTGSPRMPNGQ